MHFYTLKMSNPKMKIRISFTTGTTIKDTWTKSRGGVEVGEGGGFIWGGEEGWKKINKIRYHKKKNLIYNRIENNKILGNTLNQRGKRPAH